MYNENAVSLQPIDEQSPSISVCLGHYLKTGFLCCVSHDALLLTFAFFVNFFRIFLETYQYNYSVWCLGMSLNLIRCIHLKDISYPEFKSRHLSVSFILSKQKFSGSAIHFIDQYLIVFSVYSEYIFIH